uniref:Uncharacterized protein n=1 Tax=Spironucleus salmonicida TaxID=348837 RepID=V6LN05_9EUKA|eukprot:EST45091.1 Hypothetical protein SS50377_15111 [Spironucleus salmonicida]
MDIHLINNIQPTLAITVNAYTQTNKISNLNHKQPKCQESQYETLQQNLAQTRMLNIQQEKLIQDYIIELKESSKSYNTLFDIYKKLQVESLDMTKKINILNSTSLFQQQSKSQASSSFTELLGQTIDNSNNYILSQNKILLQQNKILQKDITAFKKQEQYLYEKIDQQEIKQLKQQQEYQQKLEIEYSINQSLKQEQSLTSNTIKDLTSQLDLLSQKQISDTIYLKQLEQSAIVLQDEQFVKSYLSDAALLDKQTQLLQIQKIQKKYYNKCLKYDILKRQLQEIRDNAILDDFPVNKLSQYIQQSQLVSVKNLKQQQKIDLSNSETNSIEFDEYLDDISIEDLSTNINDYKHITNSIQNHFEAE